MKGLIKKDLLVLKGNMRIYFMVILMYALLSITNMMDVSFILPFLIMMSFVTTFSYDEYNHWNAYAISLPGARQNIVKSKYVATILLLLVSFVITLCVSLLSAIVRGGEIDLFTISALTLVCTAMVMIMLSVMYPIIFKYGAEKGRLVMFVCTFAIVAGGGLLFSNTTMEVDTDAMNNFLDKFWYVCFIIVPAIAMYVSYLVSNKIFAKKEF